jgi:hypothetical protein
MKELRCKVCNSNKIIRKDEGYICDECGTPYTIDDLKGMLVEVPEQSAQVQQPAAPQKKAPSPVSSTLSNKKIIVPLVLIIIAALGFVIWQNTLTGDDKTAYDLMVKAAENFKNPSSVRLVSGRVVDDTMFANISATNGYGARGTGCYFISDNGYVLEEDDASYCRNEGLHVDKINKKLDKEFNY